MLWNNILDSVQSSSGMRHGHDDIFIIRKKVINFIMKTSDFRMAFDNVILAKLVNVIMECSGFISDFHQIKEI